MVRIEGCQLSQARSSINHGSRGVIIDQENTDEATLYFVINENNQDEQRFKCVVVYDTRCVISARIT